MYKYGAWKPWENNGAKQLYKKLNKHGFLFEKYKNRPDMNEEDYSFICLRFSQQACGSAGRHWKQPLDGAVDL